MVSFEEIVSTLESLDPEQLDEVARFVEYLRWKQGSSPQEAPERVWVFDFVEHARQAIVTTSEDPAGMEVQVGEASADGDVRMALWQHPPLEGASIVEYHVPVPVDVSDLCLHFATGIRDGAMLAAGNVVAFRVFVNDWKMWSDTQHIQRWKEHELVMPALAGDVLRIQFVTDGLGNHQWAWSAWAEPRLVGRLDG
ncbi:MAG TPA: hypothetical protein VLC95_10730 [Anaerolineae bacterium]|nr:hypothetical protein [Anaerolineae bacterium]